MAIDKGQDQSTWMRMRPQKVNFRHYFGGAAFLLLMMQLITGLYMIFYYEPSLRETYKTVQYFNNETLFGALTRNLHRYGAFFLGVAVFIHFWRSYFRRDYQGGRMWAWLTGLMLLLVTGGFIITGTILPWEWKGYWMMEMFNNWLKHIPLVGDSIYYFFMSSYTPTRNFVLHDIVLPIVAFTLLEIHLIGRLRKRGFVDYVIRHLIIASPIVITVVVLSIMYPVPTEDPAIIPLPMEGVYIPAPEWFFVTFLMPYWYFSPRDWAIYLFWIPAILFVLAAALPFLNPRKKKEERELIPKKRRFIMGLAYTGGGALLCTALAVGFVKGSVDAPWMGCNCCHNTAMGDRMGIPPVTYKDTIRNPLLLDNRWMMRHWYQPQVVW